MNTITKLKGNVMTKKSETMNNNEAIEKTNENVNSQNESEQKKRQVSHPNDVAMLMLNHVNAVNGKKDELTIAVKGLSDLCQQLVQSYAVNAKTIVELKKRVEVLETAESESA